MGTNLNQAPVDVLAVPAGVIGEWRGVVTVDGLPEFRTERTYESPEAALREGRKIRHHGAVLSGENVSAKRMREGQP